MSLSMLQPLSTAEKPAPGPEAADELVMLADPVGIPREQCHQACLERILQPHLQGFDVHPRRDERSRARPGTSSCHFRW